MANAGFTFTPKPQAALANLNPIQFGSALQFKADEPMKFLEQRPEVVMEGFLKGRQQMVEDISKGALSAIGSVTGAFKDARAEKLAETKLKEERQHEKDIASIRASAKTPYDPYYQSLKTELQEAKIREVENRLDSSVPTQKRSKGFFENDLFDAQNPDLPEAEPTPRRDLSSLNLTSPIPSTASAEQPKIFSSLSDVSTIPPTETGGYSLADIRTPKTSDLIYPASEGQVVFGGQTLDLMPVSGAEGKPAAKPLADTRTPEEKRLSPAPAELVDTKPPEAQTERRKPSQYEVEQYYAGEPFESIADANYAKRQMIKYGYAAKVTPVEDPTTKQRLYYVEFDEKTPEQPPEGTVLKEVKDTDGKITKTYEPVISPEKKLPMIKGAEAQLDAMIDAANQIEKIANEGYLPEFGRASSWIKNLPITTDASRVRPFIRTLQANTAFKTIMDMRKASPTGAGLGGATTDKDMQLLMDVIGSLDADNLDADYILPTLKRIKEGAIGAKNDLELEKQQIMQPLQGKTPPTIKNANEYASLPEGSLYYAQKDGVMKLLKKPVISNKSK